MKKLFLCFALLTLGLQADPVLTLSQTVATAPPGADATWGFTLTSDPLYFVSVSSAFILSDSNPALGFFTDTISLLGGPVNGALAPGALDWVTAADFGAFTVDPLALPGDSDSGQFLVSFLRYSADPSTCGSCFVDTTTSLVDFEVDVIPASTDAPEPATGFMLLGGVAILVLRSRKRS